MKKQQVIDNGIGAVYVAKIGGKLVNVRVTAIGEGRTPFELFNETTGRALGKPRSAQSLRALVTEDEPENYEQIVKENEMLAATIGSVREFRLDLLPEATGWEEEDPSDTAAIEGSYAAQLAQQQQAEQSAELASFLAKTGPKKKAASKANRRQLTISAPVEVSFYKRGAVFAGPYTLEPDGTSGNFSSLSRAAAADGHTNFGSVWFYGVVKAADGSWDRLDTLTANPRWPGSKPGTKATRKAKAADPAAELTRVEDKIAKLNARRQELLSAIAEASVAKVEEAEAEAVDLRALEVTQ